jgi:Type IV conjugative transfer system lipoprotein (TraV).
MNKNIIFSVSAILLATLTGCASDPKPVAKEKAPSSIYTKEEADKLARLKDMGSKPKTPIESQYKQVKAEMLISNPQYAEDHITEAIIENKKNDEFSSKPLFQEPLFAKVEIMPYETVDGIYHEQQSVWIKVKEGEIIIKSNEPYNAVVDSHKAILQK